MSAKQLDGAKAAENTFTAANADETSVTRPNNRPVAAVLL